MTNVPRPGRPGTILLVDRYAGVRAALADLLTAEGLHVCAEAASVAEARRSPGAVVVADLVLPDGTAVDLAGARPVVAYTWLVDDERPPHDPDALAAIVGPGLLRARLAEAVRAALGQARPDGVGSRQEPEAPRSKGVAR